VRRGLALAAVGAAAVVFGQTPYVTRLESPSGPLIIEGAVHQTTHQTTDSTTYDGTGNPVVFERPEQGLTLSANHVTLRFKPSEEDKDYVLESGTFIGKAHYHSDTIAADKALIADKKPVPKRPSAVQLDLVSERFDYAGTATEGTMTLPLPLALENDSAGTHTVKKKVNKVDVTGPEDFKQSFTLDGSSGTIVLDPGAKTPDKNRLKKGSVAGPVTFHFTRAAKGPGDLDFVTSKLDGTSDNLSFDFTTPNPTVTLEGHVVTTVTNGVFVATDNSSRTVITLDPTFKVIGIEAIGEPATTHLHRVGGPL